MLIRYVRRRIPELCNLSSERLLEREECERTPLRLEVAETIDAPPEFFSAFAENLANGSRRQQHGLPDELMGQAQRVAERIWDRVLKST